LLRDVRERDLVQPDRLLPGLMKLLYALSQRPLRLFLRLT
jgi:hypothetical protein